MIERIAEASGRDVSRETFERLERFAALLTDAAKTQNLVSASTVGDLWERHMVDAAQLLRFAPSRGTWCDVGSGAGLPGLVLAILGAAPMTLVEPRRLRAEFLERSVESLDLTQVAVRQFRIETLAMRFDIVTARAVAPLAKLFALAASVAHDGTLWLLPKGRSAQSELDEARATWQGDFQLVPSLTSADASILVARHVRRRGKR